MAWCALPEPLALHQKTIDREAGEQLMPSPSARSPSQRTISQIEAV